MGRKESNQKWRWWGSNQQPLGLESSTLLLSPSCESSADNIANSLDPE